MPEKDLLNNIKKLRELTGVGFKDCKLAIDENNGDIEKSIDYLRKKGIAKASKKMSRTASEGLVLVKNEKNKVSIIEVNSETDFVAKNKEFLIFCKELSELNFKCEGELEKLKKISMQNNISVDENLINLISKIGEKISIRRSSFFDSDNGVNFFYIHSAIEKNIGKIASVVKIEGIEKENQEIGNKIAMHIAAANPLAIDKNDLDQSIVQKETEIIIEELKNLGKKEDIINKISEGKINKFISDNTLLNQLWIMDPKKKLSDILNESKISKPLRIKKFVRFKVGEGV